MINGTAWLLQYSKHVSVKFPDGYVVMFTKMDDDGNWQITAERIDDITEEKVIEFIDGYMEQDELAINFYNTLYEVIWQVKPYRGAELV
jgi:hypothetical protein